MAPFPNLLAALGDVPDPRRAQGKRYPLPYLLMFTVLALLSGARSYRGVITFLEQRREHLNHHFGVDLQRAPVVNTLRTILQSLSTEALEDAFRRHAKALLPAGCSPGGEAGEQPVIALDGKTLRGSFDHFNDRKAAQTLTAFASASAIVLAHIEIEDKSNEIPAAQQMIRDLGLTGVVFTADAMHCQKNIPDYASSSAMVTIPSACESAIQVRHACSLRASATRASDLERDCGRSDPPARISTH